MRSTWSRAAKDGLSVRTLQRYQSLFLKQDLAVKVMQDVTNAMVDKLELDVSEQRLDSTHLFSDMATFGRTRFMGVTIKRFLTQVKRHARELYDELPEELRQRYAPGTHRLFAEAGKEQRQQLRQQVAEDLHFLIERFADEEAVRNRQTYRMLIEVFEDQCEVVEEKIGIRKNPGGDVIQNPSDPDATYDGHKGPGYQVQISESCAATNEAQLIIAAKVETAVKSDQAAVAPLLEELEERDLLPEMLLADGGYGSDENVEHAAQKGVDLQSPVAGSGGQSEAEVYELNVDDFVIDPATELVLRCPAGEVPTSSTHDEKTGKTTTIMAVTACAGCRFSAECPIKRSRGSYQLTHSAKSRRLAARRREQKTEAFRETYAKRSGGESVNSGLKRRTGLGRVRVRGLKRVAHAVYLRIAGWNILQAVRALAERAAKRARKALRATIGAEITVLDGLGDVLKRFRFSPCLTRRVSEQERSPSLTLRSKSGCRIRMAA